jgi:uncharacterized membrane protein YphA (DoxX/SURF4 family)
MSTHPTTLESIDRRTTAWLGRHGVVLSRVSLGIIFLWFGVLKFFPDLSPAAELASRTIGTVTFGRVSSGPGLLVLAVWESLIGLGLLIGRFLRITLLLLALQMIGTLLPLVLFPRETFVVFPFAPNLEGQYIIKNLVLLSAATVVGGTLRGKAPGSPRSPTTP